MDNWGYGGARPKVRSFYHDSQDQDEPERSGMQWNGYDDAYDQPGQFRGSSDRNRERPNSGSRDGDRGRGRGGHRGRGRGFGSAVDVGSDGRDGSGRGRGGSRGRGPRHGSAVDVRDGDMDGSAGRGGRGRGGQNRGRGRGRGNGSASDVRDEVNSGGNSATRGRGGSNRGRGRGRSAGEEGSNARGGHEQTGRGRGGPNRSRGRGGSAADLRYGSAEEGSSARGGHQQTGRGRGGPNRGRGNGRGRGSTPNDQGMRKGQSFDTLPGTSGEMPSYASMQDVRGARGRGRGFGQQNMRGGDHRTENVLSNKELEIMDRRAPEENALFLQKNIAKFENSLARSNVRQERLDAFLRVFAKLCQSTMMALNIQKVMSAIASSDFLLEQMMSYMSRFDPYSQNSSSIVNLLVVVRYLLNNFPTLSHGKVTLMLPHLKLMLNKNPQIKSTQVLDELEKAEVLHDAITEKINNGDCLEDDTADVDPNDFINKPILPNVEDVGPGSEPPDLKENIVTGKYKSAFQYLDTQFCLLREDLIGPLRAGIKQYRDYKEQGKEVTRLDDGYCYNNVKLLQVESKTRGLACRVQFDISHMRRIKWETSKRLLKGNLVCLSSDDFESIICATVEERETNDLVKGQVVLILESGLLTMLGDRRRWTMIEATSYLESYRYVLLRLQQLGEEVDYDDGTLPFERYFLKCHSTVEPPKYLTENPYMNFEVMVQNESIRERTFTLVDRIEAVTDALEERMPLYREMYLRRFNLTDPVDLLKVERILQLHRGEQKDSIINVLDTDEWCHLDDLGLDHSQMAALQNAITHELSVIQGPPGTGKTFIGLKFVELLLKNRKLWHMKQETHDVGFRLRQLQQGQEDDLGNHIMVMCYTNHALDQFLEGILDLDGKIGTNMLRIGGRSKTERLEPYTLRKKGHASRDDYAARDALRGQISKLDEKLRRYMKAFNYKPSDLALRKVLGVLPEAHIESLKTCGLDMVDAVTVWLDGANLNTVTDERHKEMLKQVRSLNPEPEEQPREWNENELDPEERARLLEDLELMEENVKLQQLERELDEEDWLKLARAQQKVEKKKQDKDQNVLLPIAIRRRLDRTAPMDPDVADNIEDVWKLPANLRLGLYLHWCSTHLETQDIRVQEILRDLNERYDYLDEINKKIDYEAIKRSEIIGLTTTGASKYHDLIQRVKPRIVIVEEAAEVLEAHIVTALTENCEHLVLIGDHKQLRPNPTMYKLAREYNLDISLFERMVRNKLPVSTLEFQHRMRPEISQFLVPHIYTELKDHPKVLDYDHVKGVQDDVVFLNHSVQEDGIEDTRSHTNDHEAALVVGLCDYLLKQGYETTQITVLTMYSGQMFQIRKRMRYKQDDFRGIRVVPVDNFQGEENDIIIMSYVRSNAMGKIGFLKASNRICVSISRAKMGFYCLGNFAMYAKARGNDVWKGIIGDVLKQRMLKDHIPLICANHGTVTKITTEDDYKKVPCGGCSDPCEFRLPCGHVCALSCHPYDVNHEEYQCQKPCEKKCKNGHRTCTRRCYEECMRCSVPLPVKKEVCGHEYKTPCYTENDPCSQPCERLLPCDHVCSKLCGAEVCTTSCPKPCKRVCNNGHKTCKLQCREKCLPCTVTILVTREECGHAYNIPCHMENDPCPKPCKKTLPCGHACTRPCGQRCTERCKVVVHVERSCGHEYDTPCYQKDLPCQKPCKKSMGCGHLCTTKCSETCSSMYSCKQRCTRPLSCGHICKNRCNESCQKSYECEEVVEKKLPCDHIIKVACKHSSLPVDCKKEVEVTLAGCKHRKRVQCYRSTDPAALVCHVKVTYKLACDHDITTACCEREKSHRCEEMIDWEPPCKHKAKVMCHIVEDGSYVCKKKVKKTLPCGHRRETECHVDVNDIVCKVDCQKKLACGHLCPGSCSVCQIVHQACKRECQKRLICSHACRSQCGEPCGPCDERCEFRCAHRDYGKQACSDLSMSCRLACMWQCPHHSCSKRCAQRCDRPPCDEPCVNLLSCNHLCMGLCGEPCPIACSKCRPRLFGKFAKTNTRCVSLQPCGHALPVERMDDAMQRTVVGDFTAVTVKHCPINSCKKPVLYCPRYGGVISEYLHVMTKEHEIMKKNARKTQTRFNPDLEILKDNVRRMEELAKSTAAIFKAMPNYSKVVTSLHLRLLSLAATKSRMEEEEFRIILTITECSLVHLAYMKFNQRCRTCYINDGGPKNCECPSPLARYNVMGDALSTKEKLEKLRTMYQRMATVSTTISDIEMEEKTSGATVNNKWYRCGNGHFLICPPNRNPAKLTCEKCASKEPGDLETAEHEADRNRPDRGYVPPSLRGFEEDQNRGFQFRGGFGGGGRGGRGRGGRGGGRRGGGRRGRNKRR